MRRATPSLSRALPTTRGYDRTRCKPLLGSGRNCGLVCGNGYATCPLFQPGRTEAPGMLEVPAPLPFAPADGGSQVLVGPFHVVDRAPYPCRVVLRSWGGRCVNRRHGSDPAGNDPT